jgi:hypothetical protein
MPLQIRRGTEAERLAMTVPLAAGELLYITDDQRLYVGNGTLAGGVPITGYTNEDAQDAASSLFSSGTHRGISFAYNDSLNKIDAVVSLENYNGTVRGDLIGSVFTDGSTQLIDGTSGTFNLDGTIKGDVVPDANLVYDIGSSSYRFKDLYLSGSTIYLGDAEISAIGSAVNLPAGSTVNGVAIGSGSGDGVIEGSSYRINILSSDSSTIMLNNDAETITASGGILGDLTGDVLGNVTGDVLGNVTGDVLGNVTGDVLGNLVGNVTGDVLGNLVGNVTGDVLGNITGNVLGNITGNLTGDVRGSVFGDDSGMIIDGTSNQVRGTLLGAVLSSDSTVLVDNINKTISNGIISLTTQFVSSNEPNLEFSSSAGIFRYNCLGSQPDLNEGLGDSIIAAVDSMTGLDLNATPPDLSSSFVAGDITSTIKFVSLDATRAYRSVVMGAQIDKTAFTEAYAPSKFFMVVFPDEDRDIEEGQAVEDVIRYVTYDPYGRFGVGRENAKATLDINGFMKLKVLAAEPEVVEDASIPDGFVAIADGVGWDPLLNGKQSMVVRLGGTWREIAAAA